MAPFGRWTTWLTLAAVALMLVGAHAQSDEDSSVVNSVRPRMNGFVNDQNDDETIRLQKFFGDEESESDEGSEDDDDEDDDEESDGDDDDEYVSAEESFDDDEEDEDDDEDEEDSGTDEDEFLDPEESRDVASASEQAFLEELKSAAKDSERERNKLRTVSTGGDDESDNLISGEEEDDVNGDERESGENNGTEDATMASLLNPVQVHYCTPRADPLVFVVSSIFILALPYAILRCLWPTTYAPYLMKRHRVVCLRHLPSLTDAGYNFDVACLKQKACRKNTIIIPVTLANDIVPQLQSVYKNIAATTHTTTTTPDGQQVRATTAHAYLPNGQQVHAGVATVQPPATNQSGGFIPQMSMAMPQQQQTFAAQAFTMAPHAVASPATATATAGYQPMRQVQGVPYNRSQASSRASYV